MFITWTIIDNFKGEEAWWDVASDGILLPLGAIGIALFLFDVDSTFLKSVWKVVSVLVVAGQVASNLVLRHLTLTEETNLNPEEISQWAILGADLTTVVLLVPMFALNLLYAFS